MFPDNPTPISLDLLRKLDGERPGRWIAQPKMDGWRRCCCWNGRRWNITSKRQSAGSTIPLPAEIRSALEALAVLSPLNLDCEWVGKRMVEHVERDVLWIFDLLHQRMTAEDRLFYLDEQIAPLLSEGGTGPIRVVPHWSNPGLVQRFEEQLLDPLSEGLVIRRADSLPLLNPRQCATHPLCFKVKYRNIKELVE